MKKKLLLPLASFLFLTIGCGGNSSEPTVEFTPGGNHDTDPETTITDSGNTSDLDEVTGVTVDDTALAEYTNKDDLTNTEVATSGNYYFSGELDCIHISASKKSEVSIYLDGVTINNTSGKAFYSDKNITLRVILLNGSVNNITNDFADANAFHVKGKVYITGNGTLNVTSKQKNAIKVSENLEVTGEHLTLNAVGANHAIAARSIYAKDCTISVKTEDGGKDGIQLECDDTLAEVNNEQGFAHLVNVNFSSDTYGDGIQAESYIYVSGGEYNFITHGKFVSYSSSNMSTYELTTDDFKFVYKNGKYQRVAKDEIRSLSSSYYALTQSVKGLKTSAISYDTDEDGTDDGEVTTHSYLISIAHSAKLTFNTTDDAIHANYGDVKIDSATIEIDTYDDGVHADYDVNVYNADITINTSYEGIEGGVVTVDGENTVLVLYSSDDGINAASDYVTNQYIYIKNGYLRVYASGDGLDANTGLYLQGGTVIVEGPGSGNGSLDADRVYIQGGTVFACSTGGMTEQTTASQNTFKYQGSTMSAGSEISIVDASTNTSIFTYTLKQSCNQIIFSSASLKLNGSYQIVKGSTLLTTINQTSSYVQSGSSSGGPGPGGPGGPGWR